MRGSILLLDDDKVSLRHGAAPRLPAEYRKAIDGSQIGPKAGSCGTAAYRKQEVVVEDIATDPLWEDYRDVALPHGLRACWSTPITDGKSNVLGTFAMYYDRPRLPSVEERNIITTATLLGSTIIQRSRAVSELRVRAAALERKTAELAESESRTRAARAEADHANKAKADFLATMSHELRTPLNAIGGYARLLLDGIPTPPAEGHSDYLRRILKAQDHLLSLIESVLTFAKVEAGTVTYDFDNLRIGELLDTVEAMINPQLAARRINYVCRDCDRNLELRCDRKKTSQILLNLLSNAIKFTPESGSIFVRTGIPAPGRALIGVRDTGIGMTAAQVATVFEPFVQFDNSLTRTEAGTGLGMPISREFARGMGGDLTVESTPGEGTEFVVTIPTDIS
jgi:signal transduction histidine kinase